MTTHMIRLWCEPPKGEAQNAVQNWVDNYSEWTGDPQEHGMREKQMGIDGDGTTVVYGNWRFVDEGEEPTDILTRLNDRLSSAQGGLWHRALYHVCDHDENSLTPCEWGYAVEGGTVPSDIPDIPEGMTII